MNATNAPTLSILICSLNCRAHLERCFASLYDSGDHGVDFETILVDNASSDGTVELVRERWPQVHVVANRGNVGFAHANNQALARARGRACTATTRARAAATSST